ncbi:hypothetical protein ARALYDRAFT_906551 [Arabidopsis lyrata subsp. lyrata]|uniref:Uncharacterized protein n=1 Tax=Arabidopsis lyrata subsp. lyrata TaxID=81972 RepID=D7LU04_ARALL|nr:hypothetical protein ARALYDRAFT_906551 [Arabidopsis lyrata subsp. lyrata]
MATPENHGDSSDLETAEKIILRWDSTTTEEAKENLIFQIVISALDSHRPIGE